KGPLHYQGLVRVPFIWAEPQQTRGMRCPELAGTIDIARTLLARAGLAATNGMQGRIVPGAACGLGTAEPDSMLIEEDTQSASLGFHDPIRARTLVTQRWRLSLYLGIDWGELYDLAEDPHEERNLWGCASHREFRLELVQTLVQKMMALCDRSPLPTARA
ncbi:MAG TPA: sulfatase/phosphatase domain-containing protein, partial [Burkholderiales bacterium]|nr:sulfatase/phosphatase domain-containing protein [Burkholderiales bacterium]